MIIIANSESTILVPSSKLLCVCLSSWHFPSPRNFLFSVSIFFSSEEKKMPSPNVFLIFFLRFSSTWQRYIFSFSKYIPPFPSSPQTNYFPSSNIVPLRYLLLLTNWFSSFPFLFFFSFKDNCFSQKIQNPRKKRQNSHSLLGPVWRRFWSHFLFFSIERARWYEIHLKIHSEFVACCCVKKVYKHPMSFTQKIASSRQMRGEGDKT